MTLQSLRARIGAVRIAMAGLEGAQHEAMSSIQAIAIKDVLVRANNDLTSVEKADLAVLVSGVGWAHGNDHGILEVLKGLGDSASGRRNNHDFLYFVEFFSEKDWEGMLKEHVTESTVQNSIN